MKKLRQTNITIEERKDKFGQTTSFRVRYFENSHRCSQSFKDRVSAESFVNCIKSARSIPSDIKFSVTGLVHQARFQEVCASLKLEVPAAYDECISYLTAKYSVTNPGMLLHNAISKFMITREKTKCRDRTITEYNQYLNKLENSFGAECPLCNIKGENLKSLLEAISSPSVKRNYLKILKAFFNYAAKNGWIKENPTTNIAIEHIKVDEMPPAILSVERTKSFFEKLPPNPVVQISFATACNIATQIIAQVASNQYGGQSISLAHLAPFVEVSRKKIQAEVSVELKELSIEATESQIAKIVEERVRKEVARGVQIIQYQVITLMTTNGQAPFVTVFMYLNEVADPQTKADLAMIIEETLKQRILGVKNEKGVYITPAFPKLIYVLEEDNIKPDGKYYYLTELAAKCTAKRMVPDYISEKIMLANKIDKNGEGHCYPCMGCRSFLTPYVDADGNPKYYGRFNQGVVTINLPDVGLSAQGDLTKFWDILDERLELCHDALQCRHKRLEGTHSDAAPILWQHGALLRLKKGETIDKYLHGGYSTLSLGYAGLWECVYALIGEKLTEADGEELGLLILRKLNEYTAKWKAAENIDYSLYGTPLESTTYKFAKALQHRFGIIAGVSDKNYITNSYHVHVTEPIDAFAKLELESKFQLLSPGGAISYVEVPNMQNNIPAVLTMIQFIYDKIMYAELNTKSDYCMECGYDGEISIYTDEHGKLGWKCPNCGNTDQSKMSVARRTCGYIGTQYWNQGRTQEIKERVLHI